MMRGSCGDVGEIGIVNPYLSGWFCDSRNPAGNGEEPLEINDFEAYCGDINPI